MKINLKTLVVFVLGHTLVVAQEEPKASDYNKWSLELNVGQNKPDKPFAEGYYSSDPNTYFKFIGVSHVDFGARYMFNPYFGAKLDFGYDIMQNQSGTASLPFETKQYRVGLQGVVNASRLLKFETFTNRFGLLVHGGLQVSQLAPQMGVNKGVTEDNGGLIIGLTPQFRLSNRLVITGDFSYLNNVRQHLNWDGSSAIASNNLAGSLFNSSIGITVYLGKQDKHADWYTNAEALEKLAGIDPVARKRLDDLEILLNDTDKDGVPDYLDRENNTPGGVAVDSRGRFIDQNNNGTPDEMEPRSKENTEYSKEVVNNSFDGLIEKGYINIFFDVNKDVPNSGSTNNVFYIVRYLREHPQAKIILSGYADSRGNEQNNLNLSERRVQKVYDLLVASGIESNRIVTKANGVDKQSVESTIGFNMARRVSITIIK